MRENRNVIERVLAGDTHAYADLVRKYQARIRSYCRGVLKNQADADDAAQEIFIKAYRGLDGFQGNAAFMTWIYRIAVNHCRDLLRSGSRHRTESWDELREKEGDSLEARIRGAPEPSVTDDRRRQAREALEKLSEDQRTLLLLRESEGLSYQEIAETLGCSLDAVKARLRRARRELESKLEEV